jgi:demethylsterigmatocystin 6-O-methyltransferase
MSILTHLTAAMSRSSVLLIDEFMLPNTGVPWQAAQLDMTMMCALGARERTVAEWKDLVQGAGLEMGPVRVYGAAGEGVVGCVLK